MKKTILATLLAAACCSAAMASNYYVVVPVQSRTATTGNIMVTLAPLGLPAALAGRAYAGFDFNSVLQVKGDPNFDKASLRWYVVDGSLPAGMSLGGDGKLNGTPSVAGTSSFKVVASYKTKTGQQAYQVVVGEVAVALAAASMPAGVQGASYFYDLKPALAVTGDPQFTPSQVTWSYRGALPAGLQLKTDGTISGVPTAGGTSRFDVVASYLDKSGAQTYEVVVGDIIVGLAPATLPDGLQGAAYSYDFKPSLSVTGDAQFAPAAVTWVAPAGVPAGLQLTSSGTLTGTPSAGSVSSVQVQASYRGTVATRSYPLTIRALAPDFHLVGTPLLNYDFGYLALGGAGAPAVISVTNSGTGAGTLAMSALDGANPQDFAVNNTCTNVAPAANCQVRVSFSPTAAGTRTATLAVAGSTFTFSGTGQQAPRQYVVLTSGSSYQIPVGVNTATAWVVGGGGGGAGSPASGWGMAGGGGGAGGVAYSAFNVTAGGTLSYTIAAGGSGGRGAVGGNPGGQSTLSYKAITLTANGGAGGIYLTNTAAPGGTAAGATAVAGGSGSGSQYPQGGGGGGGIGGANALNPKVQNTSGYYGSSGGGAVYPGGLAAALTGAGRTLGAAGVGATNYAVMDYSGNAGGNATGYGSGGGGASIYGGRGGNGALAGGGGGATGSDTVTYTGGTGGAGFIVLQLN